VRAQCAYGGDEVGDAKGTGARKGSISESLSTYIVSVSEKPDQRRLSPHESISLSRVSDGVSPRVPTLPDHPLPVRWLTVLLLITAAMSSGHGADLIGTVNTAPMRLVSSVTVEHAEQRSS
jgi:hypothetical protein